MQQATTPISIPDLRAAVSGRVIGPEDADYDAARTVLVPIAADRRPAAIVRVADANDVAAVVNYARDHGVELAVRSGGHSASGHSTVDGGIVLDLHDMKGLEIDAANRTAWAETGLTAGEYSAADRRARSRDRLRGHRLGRDRRHHRWAAASATSAASTG